MDRVAEIVRLLAKNNEEQNSLLAELNALTGLAPDRNGASRKSPRKTIKRGDMRTAMLSSARR